MFLKLDWELTRVWLGSHVRLIIDPDQYQYKNDYYYIFKVQFEGLVMVKPRSRVGLTIELGQYKIK